MTPRKPKTMASMTDVWRRKKRARTAYDSASRKAALAIATPKWLTAAQRLQIEDVYARAKREGGEVDHVVPLRGTNVCGLNVPWNLQVLVGGANRRKRNDFEVVPA